MSVVASAAVRRVRRGDLLKGYYYGKTTVKGEQQVVRLEPNTEYLLLAADLNNRQPPHGADTAVKAGPGVSILGAVRARYGGTARTATAWKVQPVKQGAFAFGPVNLHYAFKQGQATPFPSPGTDGQAAFLKGGGEISQTVEFPRAGAYALAFSAAGNGKGWPGYGPFDIYIDEVRLSPRRQSDYRVGPYGALLAGWGRNTADPRERYGSVVAELKAGPHIIRFVATGKPDEWVMLDDVEIAGADAIMESGFGSREALGQVAQDNYREQLNAQASYARSFGLHVVAYEAGWSLGGDFHARPIQQYCKFIDPRARRINTAAMDIFTRSGGMMNIWGTYDYWPPHDIVNAASYPLMQSIRELNDRLPAEADNGLPVPAELTPANVVRWQSSDSRFKGALRERGKWASWLIVCPKTGAYEVKVNATGDGKFEVEADGRRIDMARTGRPGAPFRVALTKGQHGIRIRNAGGSFTVQRLEVPPAAAP